jgi:serine phosphatase RsbU (regulator of sigma subunit)
MHAGDKLILASDGLIEASNRRDELFGFPEEKWLDLIGELGSLPAEAMGRRILDRWEEFCDRGQEDDCTFMVIEKM